jgi:translation initiation factor 2 beta subunit (eIF-2beta)/eIF-5
MSQKKLSKRGAPLVLMAETERATPLRLPINPAAGAAGRYKMPQLVCTVSGRNQSTAAVLHNLPDVAAALERPPSYITQYISYAASTKPCKPKGGGAISLRVDPSRLEKLLNDFIEEWVLCRRPQCRLPECAVVLPSSEPAAVGGGDKGRRRRQGAQPPPQLRCSACGHCGEVLSKQAKFIKFVYAHPPQTSGGTQHIGQGMADAEAAIAAAESAAAAATAAGAGAARGLWTPCSTGELLIAPLLLRAGARSHGGLAAALMHRSARARTGGVDSGDDRSSSSSSDDSSSDEEAPAASPPPLPLGPVPLPELQPEPEPAPPLAIEFEPLPAPAEVFMADAALDMAAVRQAQRGRCVRSIAALAGLARGLHPCTAAAGWLLWPTRAQLTKTPRSAPGWMLSCALRSRARSQPQGRKARMQHRSAHHPLHANRPARARAGSKCVRVGAIRLLLRLA